MFQKKTKMIFQIWNSITRYKGKWMMKKQKEKKFGTLKKFKNNQLAK